MQTNITLDNDLIGEALALTGAKNKSELVRMAIMELIHSRKKKNGLTVAPLHGGEITMFWSDMGVSRFVTMMIFGPRIPMKNILTHYRIKTK